MSETELPEQLTGALRDLAEHRGRVWCALAAVVARDPSAVHALRDGSLARSARIALEPFGGDLPQAHQALLLLEVYAKSSVRRPVERDIADLAAPPVDVSLDLRRDLSGLMRAVGASCTEEALAWGRGDLMARERRGEQRELTLTKIATPLSEIARGVTANPPTAIWRSLAAFCGPWLSAETGQKF